MDVANNKEFSELQKFLINEKPQDQNTLKFAQTIWTKYNSDNFFFVVEKFLKQVGTNNLKKKGFPKKYRDFES